MQRGPAAPELLQTWDLRKVHGQSEAAAASPDLL